jgi:hypothetical protein
LPNTEVKLPGGTAGGAAGGAAGDAAGGIAGFGISEAGFGAGGDAVGGLETAPKTFVNDSAGGFAAGGFGAPGFDATGDGGGVVGGGAGGGADCAPKSAVKPPCSLDGADGAFAEGGGDDAAAGGDATGAADLLGRAGGVGFDDVGCANDDGAGALGFGTTGGAITTVGAFCASTLGAEPNESIQAGSVEKFCRKCVTRTGTPSTSKRLNTFDAASGGSASRRRNSASRSAEVTPSSVCTITIRPSATSCAIWLRTLASDNVLMTRYFAANSALVIDWG